MSAEITGATGLAGRYATALFELADSEKQLDPVAKDLGRLAAMIEGSADLTRLIRSPVISREDQGRAMAAVLKKAKIGDLTRNFVGVAARNRRLFVLPAMIKAYQGLLARNRRLFVLPAMIKAYQGLLARHRGEVTAEVVSALPLTKKQLAAIGKALKKAIGSDVAVDARVDEGVLGGLVVRVGSRMIDSSLRTKLQHLHFAMKGIG